MEEAIIVTETGFTPDILDDLPDNLINNILLYKAIKQVNQNGGSLDF